MDVLIIVAGAILALVALDLAALRWGVDSRRPRTKRGDWDRDWW